MSASSVSRRAYVDVDGLQIHYRSAGEPGLPVLLLLHQSPSSSAMYEALMATLADRFQLFAPDTPGFGLSDPLGEVSVEGFAAVVRGFIEALEIGPCMVFGHHTGAAIAVQLAHDYPDVVSAMALSGPTLLSDEQREALPGLASPLPPVPDGSHLQAMWERLRAKDPDAPLALSQRELLCAFASGDAYPASYSAVTRQPTEQQLAAIQCPVLVFAGDADPLHSAVAPSVALLERGVAAELEGGERTYVCERQAPLVALRLADFFLQAEVMNGES